MRNRNRFSVSVLISTAVLSLAVIGSPARAATINFGQVDWGDGAGGYTAQNSDWGQVNLSLSLTDAGLLTPDGEGGYYGYVNVVTDVLGGSLNNWAVQNMVMYFNDITDFGNGSLPTTVYFSLGQPSGVDVSSLNYSLTLSGAPLGFQPSGPTTFASVADVTRVDGTSTDEFNPGNLSSGNAPARNYAGAAAGTGAVRGGTIAGSTTNVPAIAEAVNGCAPGSVARSLVYLSRVNPSIVITQSAQQVYAGVTNAMGIVPGTAANVLNGNQTTNSPFALGKNAFVASNGLSIANVTFTNTGLYGGFFGNPGSNALSGAINSLNSTSDVEVWLSWGTITNHNGSGTNFIRGAHQAFVTDIRPNTNAAGQIVSYTLRYIDDPVQGDTNAANALNTITILPNGTDANAGQNVVNAGVVGFFIETPTTVPEASTIELAALGIGALALMHTLRRRRRRT